MNDNIILLEDSEGNTIECETLDVFELNSETYFALLEITDEETDNDEVIIMKVTGEGEDMELICVEDDNELDAAFAEFLRRDEELGTADVE